MNPCESQIFGCTLVPREEPLQNSNSTRLLLQGRGTVTPDAPDIDFLVFSPSVTWTAVREPGVRECLLRGRRGTVTPDAPDIAPDRNVGASRFNEPDGRQGCVLAWTVESNQGGRFDSNESVSDSFPSGAVGFKSSCTTILGAFSLLRLLEKTSSREANSLPEVTPRHSSPLRQVPPL
ncbi:hypothetical protein TNCV_3863941 [Trichonephila clavipes]|nr:hypothetical protein TNCV_3863941 [Trichonephila clavipes]